MCVFYENLGIIQMDTLEQLIHVFSFFCLFSMGQTFKKGFAPLQIFFFFKNCLHFGLSSCEANRKSQKSFPFVKFEENDGSVPTAFKFWTVIVFRVLILR